MNAIEVKDLRISYKIKNSQLTKKKSLLGAKDLKKFEAVKGVSFNVGKGEIVGLIGKNGSGKSTILRALAGVFAPDSGTIELFGNRVSLLAIGIGFQDKLSGRENIMLSGLLMGFTQEEIEDKIDDIIDFSELEDFIDAPVKTYSSGMHSKLAFSITAMFETDIILIDETLSVGDRRFKKKSYKKMKEIISHEDRTVVIVSHSTDTLTQLCSRVIWINDGLVMADGPAGEVVAQYIEYMDKEVEQKIRERIEKRKRRKRRERRAKRAAAAAAAAVSQEAGTGADAEKKESGENEQ